MPVTAVSLDNPRLLDASALYDLVCRSKPLDENSRYLYMLMCSHFRESCVVARAGEGSDDERLAGAVTAYRLPEMPGTLFVWQVAGDPGFRGQGLAGRMVEHLVKRAAEPVRFLEATVTPSNMASMKLFRGLAERWKAGIEESTVFPAGLFGAGTHEEERLLRIGPLQSETKGA